MEPCFLKHLLLQLFLLVFPRSPLLVHFCILQEVYDEIFRQTKLLEPPLRYTLLLGRPLEALKRFLHIAQTLAPLFALDHIAYQKYSLIH